MDRKELRKRWVMGTIQPELFYIPWKEQKEDFELSILFTTHVHSSETIKGSYHIFNSTTFTNTEKVKYVILDNEFKPITDICKSFNNQAIYIKGGKTYYFYMLESGIGNKLIKEPIPIIATKENSTKLGDRYVHYLRIDLEPNLIEIKTIPYEILDISAPKIEIDSVETGEDYGFAPWDWSMRYDLYNVKYHSSCETVNGKILFANKSKAKIVYDDKEYSSPWEYVGHYAPKESEYFTGLINQVRAYENTEYTAIGETNTYTFTNLKFSSFRDYDPFYTSKIDDNTTDLYQSSNIIKRSPTVAIKKEVETEAQGYYTNDLQTFHDLTKSISYDFYNPWDPVTFFSDNEFTIEYQNNNTCIKEISYEEYIPERGTQIITDVSNKNEIIQNMSPIYKKTYKQSFGAGKAFVITNISDDTKILHKYITGYDMPTNSCPVMVIYKNIEGKMRVYSNAVLQEGKIFEDNEITERSECIVVQISLVRKDEDNILRDNKEIMEKLYSNGGGENK